MKVLVVGAQGMLAHDVVPVLGQAGHQVVACDIRAAAEAGIRALDITHLDEIRVLLREIRPDVVVNCAAYTNVDAAESDEDAAYRINALGPWNLAIACQEQGAALMHVSTDYVFDGLKGGSYDEYDRPNPQGVYGRSKLAGELHIQQVMSRFYIVRTAWLYGHGGKNFVETILNAAKERPELRVVDDQWGCPTWARELARVMVDVIETERFGLYHATGQGECTWWGFASQILQSAGLATPVLTQTTEELNRPAPRPRYSVMRNRALEMTGIALMPDWRDSLVAYLGESASLATLSQ